MGGFFDVNYTAVTIASVVSMIIGMIWYSKIAFGKQWIKLSGMTDHKIEKAKERGMIKIMFMAFIATFVTGIVLANIIRFMRVSDLGGGLFAGFIVWLGFIATTNLNIVLWENKPVKLYYINTGHHLVTLLVMGAILGVMD